MTHSDIPELEGEREAYRKGGTPPSVARVRLWQEAGSVSSGDDGNSVMRPWPAGLEALGCFLCQPTSSLYSRKGDLDVCFAARRGQPPSHPQEPHAALRGPPCYLDPC